MCISVQHAYTYSLYKEFFLLFRIIYSMSSVAAMLKTREAASACYVTQSPPVYRIFRSTHGEDSTLNPSKCFLLRSLVGFYLKKTSLFLLTFHKYRGKKMRRLWNSTFAEDNVRSLSRAHSRASSVESTWKQFSFNQLGYKRLSDAKLGNTGALFPSHSPLNKILIFSTIQFGKTL